MPFCFNPRARVGRDAAANINANTPRLFQSTRPRGARHARYNRFQAEYTVSIHAPAWGATAGATLPAKGMMFQSTRPRGARP